MVGMLYVHALRASATPDAGELPCPRRDARDPVAWSPFRAFGRFGNWWETRLKPGLGRLARAFPASRA